MFASSIYDHLPRLGYPRFFQAEMRREPGSCCFSGSSLLSAFGEEPEMPSPRSATASNSRQNLEKHPRQHHQFHSNSQTTFHCKNGNRSYRSSSSQVEAWSESRLLVCPPLINQSLLNTNSSKDQTSPLPSSAHPPTPQHSHPSSFPSTSTNSTSAITSSMSTASPCAVCALISSSRN